MSLKLFPLLVLVSLLGWVVASASHWYRPRGAQGPWVRCRYAPITRQLYCLTCALLVPLGAVLWLRHDWRVLTPLELFCMGALGATICLVHAIFTAECLTRVIEFNEREIRVRSIWASRVSLPWSQLSRVEHSALFSAFVFHAKDGKRFAVPEAMVGLGPLLRSAVRLRPIEVYFAARSRLDTKIPRLECEIQRSIDRLRRTGLAALGAPDDVVAPVGLSIACILSRGLHAFYASPLGELGRVLPEALSRLGATSAVELVSTANRLFGPEGPPEAQLDRERLLAAGAGVLFQRLRQLDEQLGAAGVDFEGLLRRHIDAHGARVLATRAVA
jgi:hypothetical protein